MKLLTAKAIVRWPQFWSLAAYNFPVEIDYFFDFLSSSFEMSYFFDLLSFSCHFLFIFLQDCVFTKNFSDTALHVYWTGALRVYKCNNCCKRWYFTFNGAECAAPLPIDGVVHMWHGNNKDLHRVRHIEGHCNNIHKGKVRVGFWIGNCPGMGNADGYTGWNSVSRIFVEEVPKPQA